MLSIATPFVLYLSLLLLLWSHSTVRSCVTDNESECDDAPFVPGYNLVGEGFDVVTLQRKGAYVVNVRGYKNKEGICRVYANPLQDNQQQKVPRSVRDWHAFTSCSTHLYSSVHTSISSLVQTYTNQDSSDWKNSSLDVGGTGSSAYNFASTRSKKDRYSFSTHKVTCTLYSFRVLDRPPLSYEFRTNLESLPSSYNSSTQAQYRQLIDIYGTHYIRQVYLGGRFRRVTAARNCLSRINGLSSDQVHSCLTLGINVGLGKVQLPADNKTCNKVLQNQGLSTLNSSGLLEHYTEVVGGTDWEGEFSLTRNDSQGFANWLKTLKDHPGIVRYSLRPLYLLVSSLSQRSGLKAATEQYLIDNGIKKPSEQPSCRGVPNVDSNCCPLQGWRGTLVVTIYRTWGLKGYGWGWTKAYAEMWYGSYNQRTPVINSNFPHWNALYDLGEVDTDLSLRVEIWEEDEGGDNLLGSHVRNLVQGFHTFIFSAKKGFAEVRYTLTCNPYLTGDRCDQYKPTP